MLLIQNARMYTMDAQGVIDHGDVLMDGGKILAVGQNLSCAGAKCIDARGACVLPGFVDAHCHIGMWPDAHRETEGDGNERTDPVTPQLRALDAMDPTDRCFADAVRGGVTTVTTGPGSANVFGGQFLAMKTFGHSVDDMVVREPIAVKAAFGENPKSVYGSQNKAPGTRMATAALMREALVEAQEYLRKMSNPDPDKRPDRNLKNEILGKLLTRELPVKMHAHAANDILTAIRIAREFNLDASIEHCTEGHLIAEQLRASGVKVVLGPLLTERSKPELKNKSFSAPGILHRAGVKFALMTDHGVIPIQYLPLQAGICVREGLDEYAALQAITIHAAEMIGLSEKIGSIKVGKDADVTLFDGHPLETRTHACLVVVNGQIVYER